MTLMESHFTILARNMVLMVEILDVSALIRVSEGSESLWATSHNIRIMIM